MLGTIANPYGWIAQADILLVPSLYEGYGLVAVEAAVVRTRVVPTNVPGLREIARMIGETSYALDAEVIATAVQTAVSEDYTFNFDPSVYSIEETARAYKAVLEGRA
jgi:glycosyltransferase involved in cell wall biosynthesis